MDTRYQSADFAAPMGSADLYTSGKVVGHDANLHRYRPTPPRAKTRRRFTAQVNFGMSAFRKEFIRVVDGVGIICHPTKSQTYGRVEADGRLNYTR